MIVAITIGKSTEYPESCPFQRCVHTGNICCHPAIDTARTNLYCNYWYSTAKYVDSPTRCPLVKHPVDGIKVEARY